MQDNPITDHTDDQLDPTLDCGDSKLAFEPLEGNPYAASRMGFNIRWLYKRLDGQLLTPQPVMDALDAAMEVLFPLTDFHKAPFDLFIKYSEVGLTWEEEQMLKALGVKC